MTMKTIIVFIVVFSWLYLRQVPSRGQWQKHRWWISNNEARDGDDADVNGDDYDDDDNGDNNGDDESADKIR